MIAPSPASRFTRGKGSAAECAVLLSDLVMFQYELSGDKAGCFVVLQCMMQEHDAARLDLARVQHNREDAIPSRRRDAALFFNANGPPSLHAKYPGRCASRRQMVVRVFSASTLQRRRNLTLSIK